MLLLFFKWAGILILVGVISGWLGAKLIICFEILIDSGDIPYVVTSTALLDPENKPLT